MKISEKIMNLRKGRNLSQEQFADLFYVTQQSVQKWEAGITTPDLEKLILMAKIFNISLDELILDSTDRMNEDLGVIRHLKPDYFSRDDSEIYSSNLITEYQQAWDEGLDVEQYHQLFMAVDSLPRNDIKKKMGDALFEVVLNAPLRKDYPYTEPSELEQIQALRKPYERKKIKSAAPSDYDRIYGAWMGRIAGCMLGKTVEGIKSPELQFFLKETGNYPLHRYIRHSDLTEELCSQCTFRFGYALYADQLSAMPWDDDINYLVLAQQVIEKYGQDFTSSDILRSWLRYLSPGCTFTAERAAYYNFISGYMPPQSAVYQNPYREWIGAQIRGDYFGYINPGEPEKAAEMAFRDASVSHVKNGIYGEMFVAAMLACAAETDDRIEVIQGGLAQIPCTSRLYKSVTEILTGYENGVSQEKCFRKIHQEYDEFTHYGWCHTISNAMIVTASLLYGEGDYGKSICMAVETGFDTDCNGATVGSVVGMISGIHGIDKEWTEPFCDTIETSLAGRPAKSLYRLSVPECVEMTLKHIK